MKKRLILVVLFVIMVVPAVADSGLRLMKSGTRTGPERLRARPEVTYKVTLHNISQKTVNFYLYQVDHNLNIPDDMMRAGGDLRPGRSWSVRYSKGKYYIVWEKKQVEKTLKETGTFVLNKDMDFYYP